MSKVVNLSDAKKQLESPLDRVAAGEEIVIAKRGQPMAKLVPVPRAQKRPRKPMNLLGLTYIADDFDEPWALVPESQVKRRQKGKQK
jgi:prevent-host-death family protein